MAHAVKQRVFRDGASAEQYALLKDLLTSYAKKLHGYKRGPRDVVEIFGISFPSEIHRLVLSTGVGDPDSQPNSFLWDLSLDQGKALLAKLDETAKKGESALKALVTRA